MTLEEAQGPAIEIWPDNLLAVNTFIAISTQWRVGMNGPTGLDYNVLYKKLDRMNLDHAQYDDMEEDIRAMEDAALGQIHAKK